MIPRQAGSLVILGVKRPVTGRNPFVEIEAEDYDGQSGATKQDSGDATSLGQSVVGNSGSSVFFLSTDFSDSGVGAVQLRVNTSAPTTLELRADAQTAGTLLGTCQIPSTSGAWATQTCNLTPISGVHTLYVNFGGTVRLNHLKFQATPNSTGTGGTGGVGGTGGRGGTGGSSGGMSAGSGGMTSGSGGIGTGGNGSGGSGIAGTGVDPSGAAGTGVDPLGAAGTGVDPSGAAGTGVDPSGAAGTTGVSGGAGDTGSAGSGAASGGGGCACNVGGARGPSGAMLIVGVAAIVLRRRRRRTIRSCRRSQ